MKNKTQSNISKFEVNDVVYVRPRWGNVWLKGTIVSSHQVSYGMCYCVKSIWTSICNFTEEWLISEEEAHSQFSIKKYNNELGEYYEN
jgi:hypothetical protein